MSDGPKTLDPTDKLYREVENRDAEYRPGLGSGGYTPFQQQGRQLAGPIFADSLAAATTRTYTPRPDCAWFEVRGGTFTCSWDGGATFVSFPAGSFIPASARMIVVNANAGTALTIIGWDLLTGNVRASLGLATAASSGATTRTLIIAGTDASAAAGLVTLSPPISSAGYKILELEIINTVLTPGACTLMMYGLTPYDENGATYYAAAAGIGDPAVGQAAAIRWTTIVAGLKGFVTYGAGQVQLVSGGGANALGFTSQPFPASAMVAVESFRTGAPAAVTTAWRLYGIA